MAAGAAGGEILEKYELLTEIGSGSFGVANLARNKKTRQLVAIKLIARGHKIDENVAKEIINHKSLRHPNVIRFKEVVLTPNYLAIVMEYAAEGDLSEKISRGGRISEDEARNLFQQLISGVSYCHAMRICHRDLTASNILLGRKPGDDHAYRLKICDFGFSKSSILHSRPKSTVGTPAYMAPEVFEANYDGKVADVWSCGVILYLMLTGRYPFEDPKHPQIFGRTLSRIMAADYNIPDYVHISQDCQHLLSCIFVTSPSTRITIQGIKSHPWFLENLPGDLTEATQAKHYRRGNPGVLQSDEEITRIVEEAKVPPAASRTVSGFGQAGEEEEDDDGDLKKEDVEEDDKEQYEKRAKEA